MARPLALILLSMLAPLAHGEDHQIQFAKIVTKAFEDTNKERGGSRTQWSLKKPERGKVKWLLENKGERFTVICSLQPLSSLAGGWAGIPKEVEKWVGPIRQSFDHSRNSSALEVLGDIRDSKSGQFIAAYVVGKAEVVRILVTYGQPSDEYVPFSGGGAENATIHTLWRKIYDQCADWIR